MKTLFLLLYIANGNPTGGPEIIIANVTEPGVALTGPDNNFGPYAYNTCRAWAKREVMNAVALGVVKQTELERLSFTFHCESTT